MSAINGKWHSLSFRLLLKVKSYADFGGVDQFFWGKKEPKIPVLCHLDHVRAKTPVLEHFGQVKHDFKLSFLHDKGDVHPSCMHALFINRHRFTTVFTKCARCVH